MPLSISEQTLFDRSHIIVVGYSKHLVGDYASFMLYIVFYLFVRCHVHVHIVLSSQCNMWFPCFYVVDFIARLVRGPYQGTEGQLDVIYAYLGWIRAGNPSVCVASMPATGHDCFSYTLVLWSGFKFFIRTVYFFDRRRGHNSIRDGRARACTTHRIRFVMVNIPIKRLHSGGTPVVSRIVRSACYMHYNVTNRDQQVGWPELAPLPGNLYSHQDRFYHG